REGQVLIWDMNTDQKIADWRAHVGLVNAVAFSPKSDVLASVGSDSCIRLWDVASQQQIAQMRHEGEVNNLAFSPDGDTLATAGKVDQLVKLWDVSWLKDRGATANK